MRAGVLRTDGAAVQSRTRLAIALAASVAIGGCAVAPAEPSAAVMRTTPPPWDAPRDAVSYIRAAGLEELRSGYQTADQWVATLNVSIDGEGVAVPPNVGIDRVRAVEAPLHTHEADGTVWAESPTTLGRFTVGEFFDLWGVRLTDRCLGDACGGVRVVVDGTESTDPVREVPWRPGARVEVIAQR